MKKLFYAAATLLALALTTAVKAQESGLPEQLAKLMHSENIITRFYVDAVNEGKVVEAGIRAMLKELDPHSTYSTPEEVKSINEAMQSLGMALVEEREDAMVFRATNKLSRAWQMWEDAVEVRTSANGGIEVAGSRKNVSNALFKIKLYAEREA